MVNGKQWERNGGFGIGVWAGRKLMENSYWEIVGAKCGIRIWDLGGEIVNGK